MKTMLLCCGLALMLAACTTNRTGLPMNRTFTVTELNGKTVPATATGTLRFVAADQAYNGKSFCNQYSGKYVLNGSSLKFGPAISTKMACQDVMTWETDYHKMLEQVDSYVFANDRLMLKAGDKTLATFK